MALSAKRRRFAREYLVDRCGAKAAIRAGYSAKTAKEIARQLLKVPEIAALIAEGEANLATKVEISAEYVIEALVQIVERTRNSSPNAALRGLELLGKHLGLFRETDKTFNVNLRVDESKRADEFTRRIASLAPADGAGSGDSKSRSVH